MAAFKRVQLFGGAIVADLPANFANVSDIRQVPDHQEVYLDRDGLTSIIFDILEQVDVGTDTDALQYHLKDIVGEDAEQTKIWTSNAAVFSELPPQTPAYTLFATQQASAERITQGRAPDFTGILLLLIRLNGKKTDLVITINVPHAPGEYAPEDVDLATGKLGRLLEAAVQYRDRLLQTFEVKDWSLFGQE
ncbi:hypothetical protein LTR66_005600 [Elasticomyces elasticus]|nr:hypothetical protein LTR66_005600 [Elasticomyces elasticus]